MYICELLLRESKSSSDTYNVTASSGGSNSIANTNSGSFKLSGNQSHSDTTTTEKGQNFELSVNSKMSAEANATIAGVGVKGGYEFGAGAKYGNYRKTTDTGTDSWSNTIDMSREHSTTASAQSNWSTSSGFSQSNTTSRDSSVSNIVSKKVSQQYGYGQSYSEGGSNSQSQQLISTDTKSDEYSSSLTYSNTDITSTTTSYQTTGSTIGSYRIVRAGTVHVFGVVGYDVATRSYFIYTFNVMDDDTYDYMDYSRDGTFTDYETSIIPFEIPYFVNQYVDRHTIKTDGLQIDRETGIIENYYGDDTVVYIPSYVSVTVHQNQ